MCIKNVEHNKSQRTSLKNRFIPPFITLGIDLLDTLLKNNTRLGENILFILLSLSQSINSTEIKSTIFP